MIAFAKFHFDTVVSKKFRKKNEQTVEKKLKKLMKNCGIRVKIVENSSKGTKALKKCKTVQNMNKIPREMSKN